VLDTDWFYRRLGGGTARSLGDWTSAWFAIGEAFVRRLAAHFAAAVFRHHGPNGILARTWDIGDSVLVISLVLALFLIVFYA
jgi:multicomponent Na+:H+ antiporter subunit D